MTWRGWLALTTGVGSLLAGCGLGQPAAPEPGSTPSSSTTATQVVPERKNVDAVGDGAKEHKLDLFLPRDQGTGPFPLVIWVHGGGWAAGDKSDISRAEDIQMVQTKDFLLQRGYAVAAPNYRLTPDATFPEPAQDVAASVRYLRAHGGELGVDPKRFALMGDSAGAHLAAVTAFAQKNPEVQGTLGQTGVDSSVKALVGYYGIYDFTTRTKHQQQVCGRAKPGAESSHGRLIGADPDSPQGRAAAQAASPITYAAADSPATLLFSGKQDCTAPYPQAEDFAAAITKAGGTAEVHLIDKSHGDPQFWTDPTLHQRLATFLDTHVKG